MLAIMALWQIKIYFIPKMVVAGRITLTEDELDEQKWWAMQQPPPNYPEIFLSMLPILKSWHDDLLQWGVQTSDLVEVWVEDQVVGSVSARIDCRNPNFVFIRNIFDIANEWDCNLIDDRYRIILPETFSEFIESICTSVNSHFVKSPAEWLSKIAQEVVAAKEGR
jgi:hypothetical protein